MRRSAVQQGDHLTELGAALESVDVTHVQVRKMLGGDLRSRERAMMKLGLASQESMFFIPTDMATKATLIFPSDSALDLP